MPLIELCNLTKVYHLGETKVRALDGIDLAVEPGEVYALIGPNGTSRRFFEAS